MKRLFKITASFLITAFLFFTVSIAAHSHAPAKVSESCHVCQAAQTAKSVAPEFSEISLSPHFRSFSLMDFCAAQTSQGRFELYRNRSPPVVS